MTVEAKSPEYVIFFDESWVFINDHESNKEVERLAFEYTLQNLDFPNLRARRFGFNYTALKNFESLVKKVQKVANVSIVLFGWFMKEVPIGKIRETLFAGTTFSKLITDRTLVDPSDDDSKMVSRRI